MLATAVAVYKVAIYEHDQNAALLKRFGSAEEINKHMSKYLIKIARALAVVDSLL